MNRSYAKKHEMIKKFELEGERGHSDSHQSKKIRISHQVATRTTNTEITLFGASRTHTHLAPTTPHVAPIRISHHIRLFFNGAFFKISGSKTHCQKNFDPFYRI